MTDPNIQVDVDMDSQDERRVSKRFKAPVDIEYRTLTHNPIYGSVVSSDISKGGLSFIHKSQLQTGSSIELRMSVPGDNIPIFASGTVSWTSTNKTGVKLTKIQEGDQSKVLEYIYREWLRSKDNGNNKILKDHT